MLNQLSRTELLYGPEVIARFSGARVAVFGIGGVGGYTAEALVRSGIGAIDLIDDDRICLTNLNRQVFATRATVGQYKVDAARARLLEINPKLEIVTHQTFYTPETAEEFDLSAYDYIVDAVDTVTAKLALVQNAQAADTPIISAMGAGNKRDPTGFLVADIYETSVCPLARVMRRECRKRGIPRLKVVYSREPPIQPREDTENSCKYHCICPPDTKRTCTIRRQVPASSAVVPSVAGLIIAGEVVKDLARQQKGDAP